MNKLIIIGNGFDLAHGLKTSYGQFLKSYLMQNIEDALSEDRNDDQRIFKIQVSRSYSSYGNGVDVYRTPEDVYNIFMKAPTSFNSGVTLGVGHQSRSMITHFVNFKIATQSKIVTKLIEAGPTLLWVDIEKIFYNELKVILAQNISDRSAVEKLRILNHELEVLKVVLLEHLKKETEGAKINKEFEKITEEKIYSSQILERDFVAASYFEKEYLKFEKIIFLDFNYTSIVSQCYPNETESKIIPIHGVLSNDDFPIIFGYGDEIDDVYQDIEKTNINEYMTNIKSFGYFKSHHYSDLKRTIDSDPFVVYIWGHSCGLSDRTLLNMIFENDNCVGIKIFYYKKEDGIDNYDEITQNISRHFKNKMKMRNRVLNKTLCAEIPQITQ
ncbi:AbiH family protein [Sphingobacterium corticis]|uniref:AbiH family protein n=1 Tax=Sphingobacterium corticis TaxID=1812823 RepID=A0ABW5NF01_9SPHI